VNLRAARDVHRGRIVAVFQPHTTHRTETLLDGFATAFGDADRVILTPIFRPAGRESAASEITSADLAAAMDHTNVAVTSSLEETYDVVVDDLSPGTLVVVFGAGSVTTLAHRLAAMVQAGQAAGSANTRNAVEVRA
jgi:UDP-N-acetylmuramate--alanine ligase